MAKRILLYDTSPSAHLLDFIDFILQYFCLHSFPEIEVELLFHPHTFERLPQETLDRIVPSGIKIQVVEPDWRAKMDVCKSLNERTIVEEAYLTDLLTKRHFDHLILLQLDYCYQLLLGKWAVKNSFKELKMSGVLLRPYTRIPFSWQKDVLATKLIRWAKNRIMLLNKGLVKVFLFNDDKSVNAFNRKPFLSARFEYLPDPVAVRPFSVTDIRQKYGIAADKHLLVQVGGVQRRKNILTIIEALNKLTPAQQANTCFLIAGYCEEKAFEQSILERIDNSAVQIIFDNTFIDNDLFESAIQQADLVFTVYQDFYWSSGIVGNVAKHGTALLASSEGVMGDIIRQYGLGLTVNPNDVQAMTQQIAQFLAQPKHDKTPNQAFLEAHHYLKFAEKLIQTALEYA